MKFTYYMPTKIVSGQDCVKENAALLAPLGKKVLIVTGKSSAEKIGALANVTDALDSQGIKWIYHNKIKPNPSIEDVRSSAAEAVDEGIDFIVAIGGGSPMDAAKAISVIACNDIDDEQLFAQRSFEKVLPIVAIPTTAGTGSEVTPYSILTNNKLSTKTSLNSPDVFPQIAFLDGKYTKDLPYYITAATTADALCHSAEAYLATRAIPLGQCLALESLSIIGSILPKLAAKEELSIEDRGALLYASTLAGMVIAQSGTTAVHAMGYSLTYFKGIDHGKANGLLIAEFLRFVSNERADDVSKVLSALGIKYIKALDELMTSLLGTEVLSDEEISKFASIAIKAGNIANTTPTPSEETLKNILSNCFKK